MTGMSWLITEKKKEVILFVCLIGFYISPTQNRSYGDVPALLVEEDLRCPSIAG
jgi:hypothetical protein